MALDRLQIKGLSERIAEARKQIGALRDASSGFSEATHRRHLLGDEMVQVGV